MVDIDLTEDGVRAVIQASPAVQDHQRVLAGAKPTYTGKGIYIGVGEGPEELAQYKDALAKAGYVEERDFSTKPSSLNNGKDVISFSGQAGIKFTAEHEAQRLAAASSTKSKTAETQGSTARASASINPTDNIGPAAIVSGGKLEQVSVIPKHVEQALRFNSESRIESTERLAYGYKDGGRQAQYGDEMKTIIGTRSRESIEVRSPSEDPSLKKAIDTAKSQMAGMTSIEQKATFLSNYVDKLLPEMHGYEEALKTIPTNQDGKGRVTLGQLIEAQTGVCRHRSLLFKVLADETGVPTALVRGHFEGPREMGAHAWNEVPLENGKKLLVDATHGKIIPMDDAYTRQYQYLSKKPMYDNNGLIDYKSQQAAAPKAEPARFEIQDHQRILAGAQPTHTGKGVYIGVGEGPEKLTQYKDALAKAGYIEGKDFSTKPSSLNGGKDVIAFSGGAGIKFSAEHESLHAAGAHLASPEKPSVRDNHQKILAGAEPTHTGKGVYIGVGESSEKLAQYKDALAKAGYTEGKDFSTKPSSLNGGKDVIAFSGGAGIKFTAEHDSLRATTPPASSTEKKAAATKVDIDLDEPQAGRGSTLAATGSKVDAKLGKAAIAAEAATHLAQGDVTGAATSVAKDVAAQAAIKTGVGFVAKRIPVVGGLVTAGMALFSAGSQAAQGNWKMAGAELLAGGAEAAGNIVGFGAGDAAREAVRAGVIAAGGPAAEKSGVRQLVEKSIDVGKGVIDKAKFESMNQKSLATAIAADNSLHKTINRSGTATPLAEALKDKSFRADYLKVLEQQTASGQHDRTGQIAMINAYGQKVDAAAPTQIAATPAKPAATAQASTPTASSVTPQQTAQMKSMSTSELGRAIQKDDVLPDKVKIGSKEMDFAEALKDKDFRNNTLTNLEAAQAKDVDLSSQIAMVKVYGDKVDADQKKPPVTASTPAPAIAVPMA
ncbi:MAG: hypothetical protein PHX61_07250 [Alphaproteobacteria bacterium]|nr:hypothetical protein [Alphaproteobacteria bacterium]